MPKTIDLLWATALWPFIYVGALVNGYAHPKFYYQFELPEDRECNDLSNKRKWLHAFKAA